MSAPERGEVFWQRRHQRDPIVLCGADVPELDLGELFDQDCPGCVDCLHYCPECVHVAAKHDR